MTVHGAKGLEAPMSSSWSTTAPRRSIANHDQRLLSLGDDGDRSIPAASCGCAHPRQMPKAVKERVDARARRRREEEYRRLLYVGMTRARDRLYCLRHATSSAPRSRYALARPGRERAGARSAGGPFGRRHAGGAGMAAAGRRSGQSRAAGGVRRRARAARLGRTKRAARRRRRPRHLTPSTAVDEDHAAVPSRASGSAARDAALVRGRARPSAAASRCPALRRERARKPSAAAYLAAFAERWGRGRHATPLLDGGAWRCWPNPPSRRSSRPGSRAEVEIVGRVTRASGEAAVSGRIDRLAVTPERVLIVDYKTNRPAPDTLTDAPPAYVAQLALYRALLAPALSRPRGGRRPSVDRGASAHGDSGGAPRFGRIERSGGLTRQAPHPATIRQPAGFRRLP